MTDELDRKLLDAADRLGRALAASRQQIATRHGLSRLGVAVLETLSDGRSRRVGMLAAELDVAQPTATDALGALAKRGLVDRHPDPTDRRTTLVSLSGAGRDLAAEIELEARPTRSATTGTATDRSTALRVLLGEITRLQQAGVITINRSCVSCVHFNQTVDDHPAHCLLLGLPLPDHDLRVDCPEHRPTR